MSDLLPCPFCKMALEDVVLPEEVDGGSWAAHPMNPDCILDGWAFDGFDPDLWNRRASGWISVDERVPLLSLDRGARNANVSDLVLGVLPDGVVREMRYVPSDGLWIDGAGGCGDAVTHWQPIPEAP